MLSAEKWSHRELMDPKQLFWNQTTPTRQETAQGPGVSEPEMASLWHRVGGEMDTEAKVKGRAQHRQIPKLTDSAFQESLGDGWKAGLQPQDPRFVSLGISMSFSSIFRDVLEQALGNALGIFDTLLSRVPCFSLLSSAHCTSSQER